MADKDFIKSLIKLADSLYSSSMKDRYDTSTDEDDDTNSNWFKPQFGKHDRAKFDRKNLWMFKKPYTEYQYDEDPESDTYGQIIGQKIIKPFKTIDYFDSSNKDVKSQFKNEEESNSKNVSANANVKNESKDKFETVENAKTNINPDDFDYVA